MNKNVKKALLTFGTVAALATFSANISSTFFTVHADDAATTSSSSSNNQSDKTSKKNNAHHKKTDKLKKKSKKQKATDKKNKTTSSQPSESDIQKGLQKTRDQIDQAFKN